MIDIVGAANLDPNAGRALTAEQQRIADIIQDYDSDLYLASIPPADRTAVETHPFAVIHCPAGREPYVVFRLKEDEVDHRVLARLFAGDNEQQNVLASVEASEAALQLVNLKRQQEADEAAREMSQWAIKARSGATINGVRLE